MSKTGIAIAGVTGLLTTVVAILCIATNKGDELGAIAGLAVRLMTVPLMVVAVAALFTSLRGGETVAPAVLVGSAALLGVALIHGVGSWATPLALLACAVAPLFARRLRPNPPSA